MCKYQSKLAMVLLIAGGTLAQLTPAKAQIFNIFPLTHSWTYSTNCHDGDGWETTTYDDSTWPSGPGGFTGGETSGTLLPILNTRTLPAPAASSQSPAGHAMYFRTHFNLPSSTGVSLTFSNAIDDGAVFYLNGTRLFDLRGPTPDTCASLSTAGAIGSGTDALLWEVNTFNAAQLAGIIHDGDNVLAVSVHQTSTSSSDMVFGEVLMGENLSAPAISQQPASTNVIEEQVAVLSVVAGGTGRTYQWFKGASPGGSPILNATNATLVVTNMAASGKAWTVPSDADHYHVVVSGSLPPPVTSSDAIVTVTADTTAPTISYAVGSEADASLIVVVLSEPLDPPVVVTDNDSWAIQAGSNPGQAPVLVDYTPDTTTVTLHLTTARDPFVAYTVRTVVAMQDRAVTPNTMPAGTSVRVNCFATELLPLNAHWRYLDNDSNPGDSWFSTGFDDSSWKQGPGPFDAKRDAGGTAGANCRDTTLYSLGAVGTCLSFSNSAFAETTNCYFRAHFNYSGYASNTVLQLNGKFDDTAVVYLNGVELERVGLPAAPAVISRGAYSDSLGGRGAVGDGDAQDVGIFGFPATLQHGDNMIAVMLIQANGGSSDITMGLRVASLTQDLLFLPRLTIDPLDLFLESHVHWTGPGVLQEATRPTGPWTDVDVTGNPPGSYDISPTGETGDTGNRYFRLREP